MKKTAPSKLTSAAIRHSVVEKRQEMAVDAVEDTVPIHELNRQCAINEANWRKVDMIS
jgi:hypothetical protein